MTSSTQDLLPQPDIGNTFGALFIGVNLAAMSVDPFVYYAVKANLKRFLL